MSGSVGLAQMGLAIRDELTGVVATKPCCRRAEVASLMRLSGGVRIIGGQVIIEAELGTAATAQWLCGALHDLYDVVGDVSVISAMGRGRRARYLLRVVRDGESVARRSGLLDFRGRPVRGLPPAVVSGGVCDAQAAWRGAFMVQGTVARPGLNPVLETVCPGQEVAMALTGMAKRLGVTARWRESRGEHQVIVKDADEAGVLLTRMGAPDGGEAWARLRSEGVARARRDQQANFGHANLMRATTAATRAVARATDALAFLGDDVPPQLLEAALLRIRYPRASLDQLAGLAESPMTKDAIAGRLRRLLSAADKRAAASGVPDTRAVADARPGGCVPRSPGPPDRGARCLSPKMQVGSRSISTSRSSTRSDGASRS